MLLVFIYAILFVCHDALCAVHHLMMTIQLNSDSPSALADQFRYNFLHVGSLEYFVNFRVRPVSGPSSF